MKELVTARNVVNTDEILAWTGRLAEQYPSIAVWINGTVRKWINKNAPTVPFQIEDTTGLPEWLKKSMDGGNQPENVVLDEALEARITPVLDYMTDLIAAKPDTNVASIGFDVAEARSIKWHADMAKNAEKVNPIAEDGAVIVKDYGNGWTWRKLVGKECLINEGEAMGHCVGRFGYYERIIRAKVDIFSLRGPDNSPHVTIEANMATMRVVQIKGRANQDVVPKYLPMVRSFLNDFSWNTIAYDGASSLAVDVRADQLAKNKAVVVHGNMRLVRAPSGWTGEQTYEVFLADANIGSLVLTQDGQMERYTPPPEPANIEFLCHCIMALKMRHKQAFGDDTMLRVAQAAGIKFGFWEQLLDGIYTDALCQMYVGERANWIFAPPHSGSLAVRGFYIAESQTTLLTASASLTVCLQDALALEQPQQNVYRTIWGSDGREHLLDISNRVQRLQAGKKVEVAADDETLLNSLLTALKQPDVATIKAAYKRMRDKDEVTDSHMKQLGMPVSGRSINGIAAVMMCTLPLKNLGPFRKYVFSKPNLLNCWSEILTKPDHILIGLKTYGLSETAIGQIVELLRNEYLRLVPDEKELAALELDLTPRMRVQAVMTWARGHRKDLPRSKQLWGPV